MNSVAEDIADDLEIGPEQRPAFDTLIDQLKEVARTHAAGLRQTGEQLHEEFGAETPDPDRVAAILKEHARQSMPLEQKENLIDEIVDYYKTLDSEQQAAAREKIGSHLDRFF